MKVPVLPTPALQWTRTVPGLSPSTSSFKMIQNFISGSRKQVLVYRVVNEVQQRACVLRGLHVGPSDALQLLHILHSDCKMWIRSSKKSFDYFTHLQRLFRMTSCKFHQFPPLTWTWPRLCCPSPASCQPWWASTGLPSPAHSLSVGLSSLGQNSFNI